MSIPEDIKDKIKQAFLRFNPKQPVTTESPFYVSCDDVRGEVGRNIAFKIAEWIEMSHEEGKNYAHCLFTGHVGSGKSSEILNTKKILEQDNYHVIYLNAMDSLDINDVYPTDVLFSIAAKIQKEMNLSQELLKNIERWFAEIVYETSDEKTYKGLIEAGMDMGSGIPLIGKLFAKFSGQISRGGSERETIRRQLRKNVSELLRRVNEMIQEAEQRIRHDKKGLVIIIDELEKMTGNILTDENQTADICLYINNSKLLTGLNCHLICTVPIFLLNSKSRTLLEKNFDKIFELPVIKVKKSHSDDPFDKGIDKLVEISTIRLEELDLFGGKSDLLRKIAFFSGGQVRIYIQLMRNILAACRTEQTFPADERLIEYVLKEEKRSYDMAIFDDRFKRLAEISKTKKIKREEDNLVDFEMLQHGWILAYVNDEWWYDVMPVIKELERFKKV